MMTAVGGPELLIIFIVFAMLFFIVVVPFWFICKKAGFSPWLSLIMLIPGGALVLPSVLAFVDWPSLRSQRTSLPPR
jgi:hypothetical protein